MTQLLRVGVDIRPWYPDWALNNPPDEESPTIDLPFEPAYASEWARYALWHAVRAPTPAIGIGFRRDVNEPGAIDVLLFRTPRPSAPQPDELTMLLVTSNVTLAREVGRIVAAELHVPLHPMPDEPSSD